MSNIFKYLENFSGKEFSELYQNKNVCLAIYKSFHDFGQYLIRSMLYKSSQLVNFVGTSGKTQTEEVSYWEVKTIQEIILKNNDVAKSLCDLQVRKMLVLHICEKRDLYNGKQVLVLSTIFGKSLRKVIGFFPSFSTDEKDTKKKMKKEKKKVDEGENSDDEDDLLSFEDKKFQFVVDEDLEKSSKALEKFTRKKWEKILYFIVGFKDVDLFTNSSVFLKKIIGDAGLVDFAERKETERKSTRKVKLNRNEDYLYDEDFDDADKKGERVITSNGFQFLLKNLKTQLWVLINQYLEGGMLVRNKIKLKDEKGKEESSPKIEILNFLFSLSFLQIGKPYHVKNLSSNEKILVRDFKHFGVIKEKDGYFYVTPLASEIMNSAAESDTSIQGKWEIPGLHGKIIVQTNFKFYAYTDSPIQISILSLFAKLEYKTPNLVVGLIERDSVQAALQNGITSDQIIGYMWIHAHEKTKLLKNPIPINVINQLRLWEKERNRISHSPALFFDNFELEEHVRKVAEVAKQKEWFMWMNPTKKWLVVKNVVNEKENSPKEMELIIEKVISDTY